MSTAVPRSGTSNTVSSNTSSSAVSNSNASRSNRSDASPSPEHLPDDPAVLKQMILELLATLHHRDRELDGVRHRLDQLLRRLYGPRGERFDPNQPLLFGALAEEQPPASDASAASAPPTAEPDRKPKPAPHGRRTLPAHLPRQRRDYELSLAERLCATCGETRVEIGVETSEQLEYRPASLFVVEHCVHKYVCPCCSATALAATPAATDKSLSVDGADRAAAAAADVTPAAAAVADKPLSVEDAAAKPVPLPSVFLTGAKPPQPIAKGMPGPGLLAHLIVSKYVDHLPLYRLERVYERQGLVLPRSTTCDWLAACAKILRPLYERMKSIVLQSRVLHTDDTKVKIHDPPPGATDLGRLWVYLGDPQHPCNVFDFTPNRRRDGPVKFLEPFQGFLQADAFSGYDSLYLPHSASADGAARIVEVACNAHARRKFHEARTSDAARSHQALAWYGQLYEIERRAKELQADDALRRQLRQDLAVPILVQMHAWLEQHNAAVVPKSPMGEAITYALNQWTALVRYTEHGFLAIDNNVAEREMKRIAIGRKNWLFVGSENGGHTAAVLFSFTSTCQRLKIEPWAYLRDVLTRLPNTPPDHLADLLPDHWQAAQPTNSTPPGSAS